MANSLARPLLHGAIWAVVAVAAGGAGCQRDAPPGSADDSPAERERQAVLSEALAAVERSTGQERLDARFRFHDVFGKLPRPEATKKDAALVPRIAALLTSPEDGDVELGVMLLGQIGDPRALPKLWPVLRHPRPLVRGRALQTIARVYRDPKLLPVIKEAIAHDEPIRMDAISALGPLSGEPGVADYLRQLFTDPKCVTVAEETMKQAGIDYDRRKRAVAQLTHSDWQNGVSIDHPESWPNEDLDGYGASFRNAVLGARYGYKLVGAGGAKRAVQVLSRDEKTQHLKNALPPEARAPAPERWKETGATDAVRGEYSVTNGADELVRRVVVLLAGKRAVIVEGEAPPKHADELKDVFERMWPTVRISEGSPDAAANLNALMQPQGEIDLRGLTAPSGNGAGGAAPAHQIEEALRAALGKGARQRPED